MIQQFAVGDRVIVIDSELAGIPLGTVGTLTQLYAVVPDFCDVQFDQVVHYAVRISALAPAPSEDASTQVEAGTP